MKQLLTLLFMILMAFGYIDSQNSDVSNQRPVVKTSKEFNLRLAQFRVNKLRDIK